MQDTIDGCLGWITQYNPLSVAKGALVQADNCVIQRENIIENRRGYASYATLAASGSQLLVYSRKVLAHHGTTLSYDNGSGTFSNYSGTYSAPSGNKMRGIEVNSNLMITTTLGVQVLTDVAGTAARKAGAPRCLNPEYALNAAGSGFLSNTSQCAYRALIQRTDANRNVLYGYPSQRVWVTNSSGSSKNIDLTLYLPSEAIAGDVIQFYRTTQQSGVGSDAAGDEMGLVYQVELSSSDISTGFIPFTDSVVDVLRGATLYISPSQEGIAQANDRPPLCKDMALYKSAFMFYANTTTKQRFFFSLLGTGSLSGKTITLAGVTYNFGASEIISGGGSPQVLVSATGVPATDIDLTTRSLVKVINRYSGNTSIYAYYLSGSDELPGQMMLEERSLGGSAFTLQASDTAISAMFSPAPPISPATSTKSTSSNDIRKNGLSFAKSGQPEHVPLLNYVLVGPSNTEILRIAPLRDSLIIIKEEGIYRLTGEDTKSFSVVPLDLTVFCKTVESVVVLANQVFMLSNQGVVSISDTGVAVVSREIESELLPLLTYSNLSTYAVGCAYESDRSYLLSTVDSSSDTSATQILVYNIFTRAWSRFTYGFSAAIVEPNVDKLFFIKSSSTNIYRERKDFTDSDYADPELNITITAILNRDITFTLSGSEPSEGWVISQGGTGISIDSFTEGASSYTATMTSDIPASWTTGVATLYPSVGMQIEWAPWSAGQPGILKQARSCQIINDPVAGNSSASSMIATFKSNFDPVVDEVEIVSQGSGWGSAWGEFPWGGSGGSGFPTYIPLNKQYCGLLMAGVKFQNANEKIAIAACSFTFETISEKGSGR